MSGPRITPNLTWRPEFYFLASLIKTPRYIHSVSRPQVLFANEKLFCIWRMLEQAINLRGKDDPLLDNVGLDEVTLTAEFSRASHMDVRDMWTDLMDPTIRGAPEKFHRILEYYAAARTIDQKVCDRLGQLSNGSMGPEDAVHNIQRDLVSIYTSDNYTPSNVRTMLEGVWEARDKNPTTRIRTGFHRLDETIGALVPGCTYLWAARTSHGKSSWVGQVVTQQAQAGHRIGVIGLEDSPSIWASRWMSRISGVPLQKIRDNVLSAPVNGTSRLTDKEQSAILAATKSSHLDNITFIDAKGGRLLDIMRAMSELVVRHGAEVVWIDYLQAIYADSRDGRSRRDFLEYSWAMLEREAERLQVPLMITAQLNRAWEAEPLAVKPGLRHVEWMGAAEQKCYMGAVIYRPYKDPRLSMNQQNSKFNELIVNIEKCKQGDSIAIPYHFSPEACLIREMERADSN